MTPVFYDFETFWSAQHSLTKMNPIVYVKHPETEIQSCSFAVGDGPVEVLFGADAIRDYCNTVDWSDKMAVAFNGSGFDHMILAWRFGIKPKAWGCALAMARPVLGQKLRRLSLDAVSKALKLDRELGAKGSLEAINTRGKKLADFTAEEIDKMRVYNAQDTVLLRGVFNELLPHFTLEELRQIDMTCRMLLYPQLKADVPLLRETLAKAQEEKRQTMLALADLVGIDTSHTLDTEAAVRDVLMSQDKFRALLEKLGIEVPLKPSPKKKDEDGNPVMIPALAKSDEGMAALLEHEDYRVQVAASARLEIKSTQLESRIQTFMNVADVMDGWLPVPLNYCGAKATWRLSGGMKMNMQNLPRIDPDNPTLTDALRKCLLAPDGHVVLPVDSSNIEMRIAHTMAGEQQTLALLSEGADVYSWFAEKIFGYKVSKKTHPTERFVGKVAMLSLQYGSSWLTFKNMVRNQSKGKLILPDDECKRIVYLWRDTFSRITDRYDGMWARCETALTAMSQGQEYVVDEFGLCVTQKNMVITPKDHWLSYPNLRYQKWYDSYSWVYGDTKGIKIYGAHLFENICQHLARLVVMEQSLALDKYYPVALSCHDEAVFVPSTDKAEEFKKTALRVFSTSPAWWPQLPLAAEAELGACYGDAK